MVYIDEIKKIINMRLGSISQNRKTILDYFRELSHYKKICLFGAGQAGKAFYYVLKEQDIEVKMFCDNDRNKWGKVIIDYKQCVSYEELEKCKDNVVCIISTGPDYSDEINKQLLKSGFKYIYGRELLISQTVHMDINDAGHVKEKLLQATRLFNDEYSLKVLYYKLKSFTADLNEWSDFSFHDILDRNSYATF